jgi:putative membrane protein
LIHHRSGFGSIHLRRNIMNTVNTSAIGFAAALLVAAGTALGQGAAPAAAPPTDPQIAHIVVTANQVDIDAGKLAQSKGHSKEVKDFGKMMVTDHTGVNKQATALVTKLKVKPEDNATSESLKKGGNDNLAKLKGLRGDAFDKAYIEHEVAYHEQVLDAVDKVLIPNAKNAELKALIEKVRPAFVAHLEHAKMIQGKIAKS